MSIMAAAKFKIAKDIARILQNLNFQSISAGNLCPARKPVSQKELACVRATTDVKLVPWLRLEPQCLGTGAAKHRKQRQETTRWTATICCISPSVLPGRVQSGKTTLLIWWASTFSKLESIGLGFHLWSNLNQRYPLLDLRPKLLSSSLTFGYIMSPLCTCSRLKSCAPT